MSAARGRQSEYQKTIINSGKMRYLKIKNSALCCVWEDASIWAHWNHFFHIHLSYPGPATRFLIFHILNSSFTSFLVQLTAAGSQACSPSQGPSDPRNSYLKAWIHWWLLYPCSLIWPEIFHFTVLTPNTYLWLSLYLETRYLKRLLG